MLKELKISTQKVVLITSIDLAKKLEEEVKTNERIIVIYYTSL